MYDLCKECPYEWKEPYNCPIWDCPMKEIERGEITDDP